MGPINIKNVSGLVFQTLFIDSTKSITPFNLDLCPTNKIIFELVEILNFSLKKEAFPQEREENVN